MIRKTTEKLLPLNGIELNVDDAGDGPVVVMVMGTGSPGRVWKANQQPALLRAGFRVVTFDNRGIAPSSECGEGFTLDDMVSDTIALIEHLDVGPVLLVGTSLGGRVVAESTLRRPDLVRAQVLMGTYARLGPVQQAISAGERALVDQRITLPPEYHTAITAHLNLSPHTLDDEVAVRDWLDIIEFSGQDKSPGARAQMGVHSADADRRDALRQTTRPTMVVTFADDRTIPPGLSREVAEAIPGARHETVAKAGHWGYLERPDDVNALLLDFLAAHR
ncbi:alpha/beta fold hydrolase [Williamsia sterculiae]|uniref:Pimeloyl-ACP methyl ester carboxylesterase n=1 Tax=Williamsia sterculiae TaxID=1344003 RepID=A0A1N7G4I6_9NOCA|nr:alpha/beta fold hydrolase [Williamsia sterculiae]SIS07471.1 Pimeloyl-ACP methyl ester carboxylesterase [Williamsia sterculiae]